MTEYEVEDSIPCTDSRDLVYTLVEESHYTDLFFKVFFSILFLIELGVGSWESHLHISHPWSHHDLVGESHETDTDPENDYSNYDIDHIISEPNNTIPNPRPSTHRDLFRMRGCPDANSKNSII
jgi:hypothetical protein